MRSREYPGHAGGRLREWLSRWLGVGRAQRLRAETRAEALTTAYCHRLIAELHNLKVLDVAKPFDLETFYVPLQVREEPHLHVGESEMVERKVRACPESRRRTMSPEEALIRFRHLAVLGDPGAGKTTILRYLTLLAAQGRLEDLPDFPILVPLGHFVAVPQVNLLDFVIGEIEARYGFPELHPELVEGLRPDGSTGSPRWPAEGPRPDGSTGSPRWLVEGLRPYLEERLEKGSVLFLLDGLDEASVCARSAEPLVPRPVLSGVEGLRTEGLTTKPQEAEATYRHVVGQINVLAARYPNCPMIVTARRGGWKGLLAASFHTVEVLGFNRDDIQRFIVNLPRGRGDQERGAGSDRARDLQDALSQNPRMWALAANPLLLSLMAFAFEQDGKLPDGRAGLYERSVELLLREEGKDHHDLGKAYSLTTEHKRSLLEEVALHFHLRRVLLCPEEELREVIASYLPAVDIPTDQVSAILQELSGPHGLLREQAAGWYGFPHPTWQEYFAAAAISKRGQLELALEGLHDPWWEGTVLFLAGVLEDAMPLLEGILAQEEDIFHSNLLLAGRCLAGVSRIKEGDLWENIIEELKRLVKRGYHRLLQRQAVSVLAEIGGEVVVSFFVALLRAEEIDPSVLAEVPKVLGSLHPFDYPFDFAQDRDKSVVPDLLAFLTDEKLDPSVRGNIAEALGSLGDDLVIPPLLALLPDETVDPSVRGRIVEALVTLGGESIVSPLLASLPDEGIDPYVRLRITEVLASLGAVPMVRQAHYAGLLKGDKSLVSQLLSLLPDEKIHPSVRRGVAEAVGSLGDESAVPDLLALLSNEKVDPSVRGKAAEALGALGAESTIPALLVILGNEKVDFSVRMTVAEVLGVLGDESVASQLLALVSDEKIDPDVRASIADALGILGEKSVIPQLLPLLPDERIDPAVRWRIVDALSSLGDKKIIPHLRALLPNEKIDSSVRWMVAEALEALSGEPAAPPSPAFLARDEIGLKEREEMAEILGSLDDRSRVPQLLALLKDERIDPSVSDRIIEALASLGDDRAAVEGLAALLDREDIGSRVYEALFHVSQRAGMRVFARKGQGYEVRPLSGVYPEQIRAETSRP